MSRLERRRESVSGFEEGVFDDFVPKDDDTRYEKTVMSTVCPIVRGSAEILFGQEKLFGKSGPAGGRNCLCKAGLLRRISGGRL
ncbi:hypothetical protein BJX63DRAFT_385098 [Aspergillus granulosus]|uniref:Uncharacterized protein n=1 Tax=Aspergillus granulosus TaxID=176169 RepID=A0ABR4HQR6_9EURO